MAKDSLKELHAQLEVLRVEFERYFMGLERRMPSATRDRLVRQIRRFDSGNDAVLRFKHRNLVQRLMVLEQYWNRTMRAMEAGTYSRDLARADFRATRRAVTPSAAAQPSQQRRDAAAAKAREVGEEASAFLDALGQSDRRTPVAQRGQPVASSSQDAGHPNVTKRPNVVMRGRSKKT